MTSRSCRIGLLTSLLALLWLVPASAQYATDPPPVDSPYWWTLTDQITSQELYDALQSRERNQDRLRQAILEGRYEAVPKNRIDDLSLFIDGQRTPELYPMWDAFISYAHRFSGARPNYEEIAEQELSEAGISTAGVSQVIALANRAWSQRQAIIAEVGAEQRRFAYEILGPANKAYGRGRVAEILKRRDFGRLAQASGYDRQSVERLHGVWRLDPSAQAAVDSVERLRTVLSDSDWELFRQYLRTEVASRLSYSYFSERPLR